MGKSRGLIATCGTHPYGMLASLRAAPRSTPSTTRTPLEPVELPVDPPIPLPAGCPPLLCAPTTRGCTVYHSDAAGSWPEHSSASRLSVTSRAWVSCVMRFDVVANRSHTATRDCSTRGCPARPGLARGDTFAPLCSRCELADRVDVAAPRRRRVFDLRPSPSRRSSCTVRTPANALRRRRLTVPCRGLGWRQAMVRRCCRQHHYHPRVCRRRQQWYGAGAQRR